MIWPSCGGSKFSKMAVTLGLTSRSGFGMSRRCVPLIAIYSYVRPRGNLKKRNTPMDDDDDDSSPGRRRQWSRSPPMHFPRQIPRTDPTEDMHGQLLVARRGRGRRLGAAIARRQEGRAWRWPTPSRRPDCRPSRWPYDVAAGRSRPRDSS